MPEKLTLTIYNNDDEYIISLSVDTKDYQNYGVVGNVNKSEMKRCNFPLEEHVWKDVLAHFSKDFRASKTDVYQYFIKLLHSTNP